MIGNVTDVAPRQRAYPRLPIVMGTTLVAGLAWALLVFGGGHVHHAGNQLTTATRLFADFGFLFTMWSIMAIAMMLPIALPAILTFADIQRAGAAKGEDTVSPALFAAGYLCAWLAFGLAAATAQWGTHIWVMAAPAIADNGWLFSGLLLLAAGLYQWTPLKNACLIRCRAPMQFFLTHWRTGNRGAVRMGFRYGVYCVGCCWLLMTLMLISGMFNLLGMALLTVYMLFEKIVPDGRKFSRAAGLAAVLGGCILLLKLA